MNIDNTDLNAKKDKIRSAFARARTAKPVYAALYPILEPLFLLQAEAKSSLELTLPEMTLQTAKTAWEAGFPLIRRWDFPLDIAAAESVLKGMKGFIPIGNRQLMTAHEALTEALARSPSQKEEIWKSFLQHEWEPWEEWVDMGETDTGSLLFLARNCLRPSIERTAEDLLTAYPLPESWLKGYCPICGSLPALLFLEGEGERKAHCSWCGAIWGLQRLQCPYCDNQRHESLGYLYTEAEPNYRMQYCELCKYYFKMIDTREQQERPFLALEELTTLHLDILAQREGWKQPASPSPVVYGDKQSESGVPEE